MKKTIVLIGLIALALVLSGCTQPEPTVSYKFVCSDGTVVADASQCAPGTEPDLEELCADYCEEQNGIVQDYTADYVQEQIDAANYCSVKEDCAIATRKCPFGCYPMVNRSKLDEINELIGAYRQTCMLTCANMQDYACDEGKCKPVVFGEIWDSY